jgi:hypothetical protein
MPLARVGGEVCAPDLDRDARGGEAALAQPGAASIREADQFRSQLRVVLDVGIESLLGADLDFLEIGYDGTIVDPRRRVLERARRSDRRPASAPRYSHV